MSSVPRPIHEVYSTAMKANMLFMQIGSYEEASALAAKLLSDPDFLPQCVDVLSSGEPETVVVFNLLSFLVMSPMAAPQLQHTPLPDILVGMLRGGPSLEPALTTAALHLLMTLVTSHSSVRLAIPLLSGVTTIVARFLLDDVESHREHAAAILHELCLTSAGQVQARRSPSLLSALDQAIDCEENAALKKQLSQAKRLLTTGCWGWARVVKAFGSSILNANGEIDREVLGQLVFADVSARRKLNAATHLPVAISLLIQVLKHWLSFKMLVVVDMPLLFETGSYKLTRPIIVVRCSHDREVSRLMERNNLSRDQAEARISAQMPLDRKAARAGIVIDNDGSLEQLEQQVAELAAQLKRQSSCWGWVTSPAAVVVACGVLKLLLL